MGEEDIGDFAGAAFSMKPATAIETLARGFVSDQRTIAQLRKMVEALPANAPDDVVAMLRTKVDAAAADWIDTRLPHLAAGFRLALEVLDTYGPEGVRVEDAVDAGIWDNKYFVWLREFGGAPSDTSG